LGVSGRAVTVAAFDVIGLIPSDSNIVAKVTSAVQ